MKALKRFDDEVLAHKIEGLRFALYSVNRAFSRIENFCREREKIDQIELNSDRCFDIFMDCWQVVDGADRARAITETVSNWERCKHERREFLRSVSHVRPYRNTYHHLETKAKDMPTGSAPIVGALSWISKDDPHLSLTLMLDTGSIKSNYPGLTFDRAESRFIGDFSFQIGGNTISLARIALCCKKFWISMDESFLAVDAYAADEVSAVLFGFKIGFEN